jgi:hypothetical protein
VDTEAEVSAKQINGVRVRFVPEIGKDWTGKIVTRSLISDEIIWVEYGGKAVPADSDEENEEDEGGGESGGGESGEGGGGGSIDPNA